MMRICDECGERYDDLDHLTYCPHDYFLMNTVYGRMKDGLYEETTVHSVEELLELSRQGRGKL